MTGINKAIAIGPLMPGIAPISTPRATPIKTNIKLFGDTASSNPATIISMVATPGPYPA